MSAPDPGPLLRALAPPPDTIEALSLQRLESDAGALPWTGDERRLALRLAYAIADPTIFGDLEFAPGALASGIAALTAGQPLFVDVRMVAGGIDRMAAGALGVDVRCLLDGPGIAEEASRRGITRSAQGVLAQAAHLTGAVVAIGNAPTALLALLDVIDAGLTKPALVIGFPVGYVAATESKEELRRRDVPYLTLRGRRGGTPLAVSAVNTLLRIALERRPGAPPKIAQADAILLIGHGSREPEAARAMERVMAEMAERGPVRVVEPGFVQLTSPTIPEGIGRCVRRGARTIVAVPYFLHDGKHVLRDLPPLLRQAAQDYPGTSIHLSQPIGSHLSLTEIALDRALRGPFISEVQLTTGDSEHAEDIMKSAAFVYRDDGRPDWQRMWESFCELALFGGPPHRGPDHGVGSTDQSPPELAEGYDPIQEIQRGILETSGLESEIADPGWLRICCANERMAAWMCATIILENVEARSSGNLLYVPARRSFTLENEVKSVITVIAKAHHYWSAGHVPPQPVAPRDRGPGL